MKKKLDVANITNELRGQSVFFPQAKEIIQETDKAPLPKTQSPVTKVTDVRTKIRHPFDIFQDQLIKLTDIQNEILQRTKKKPTLGSLVQNALDEFINNWDIGRTDERTNGRSNGRPNV